MSRPAAARPAASGSGTHAARGAAASQTPGAAAPPARAPVLLDHAPLLRYRLAEATPTRKAYEAEDARGGRHLVLVAVWHGEEKTGTWVYSPAGRCADAARPRLNFKSAWRATEYLNAFVPPAGRLEVRRRAAAAPKRARGEGAEDAEDVDAPPAQRACAEETPCAEEAARAEREAREEAQRAQRSLAAQLAAANLALRVARGDKARLRRALAARDVELAAHAAVAENLRFGAQLAAREGEALRGRVAALEAELRAARAPRC
jgi:hypothetical protein